VEKPFWLNSTRKYISSAILTRYTNILSTVYSMAVRAWGLQYRNRMTMLSDERFPPRARGIKSVIEGDCASEYLNFCILPGL
jgi:hypothetical protein